MKNKFKVFKLTIFSIILALMFVFPSLISAKTSNIPIYIQTLAGIESASYDTIVDFLFNYNFKIKKITEYVPDEKCSLRADGGFLNINNLTFISSNLVFHVPLKDSMPGTGSLIAQNNKNRFSLKFEINKILETNAEKLIFEATGIGNLNKNNINFNKIIVFYDKINNKVSMDGYGDKNFTVKNINVNFVKWCSGASTEFFLVTLENKLNQSRSLDEVKELIKQHPELVDKYENLRNLNENPIPLIPEFGVYVGILTLVSAIGLFFIVRRK